MFKNDGSFRPGISNIDNKLIDNAEDLDKVISMYNLIEYSNNYSMLLGSLWNYYRDEIHGADNASEGKS